MSQPPQEPIADPLARAAVEANASRLTAIRAAAPDNATPSRERMTHILDQEEAFIAENTSKWSDEELPVIPSSTPILKRLHRFVGE